MRLLLRSEVLTDGIQLDVLVPQVLRVHCDVVLRLAVSDEDADLPGLWTHTDVSFEVALEDVVQCKA